MHRLRTQINWYSVFTYAIPLIIALSIILILKIPITGVVVVLTLLTLIALIIVRFNLQIAYLKILVFFLPLSIEIPFLSSFMILIPTEPMIALALMVFIIDILTSKLFEKIQIFKEFIWFLPLIAAFIISIIFSEFPSISVKFALVNIAYIIVFYFYIFKLSVKNPQLFIQLILIYCLGVILVAFWALYQFWKWEWNPVVVRGIFYPFYKDNTIFGAATALLASFWLSFTFVERNNLSRIFPAFIGLLFVGLVILSTSRASFLSLLVFFTIITILLLRVKRKFTVTTIIIFLFLVFIYRTPIVERMKQINSVSYDSHADIKERMSSVGNITTDVSNIERLNRWISAWRMFKERPFAGFGPGTYQFVYVPYQDDRFKTRLTVSNPWDIPENSGGTAHSEYLLVMSEMGVLGIFGWLLLIGRWFHIAFSPLLKKPRQIYVIIAFSSMSTYLFHALFNNFLNTDKLAFLFWGMAAWLTINYYYGEKKLPAS
jgi:putative inorganic carbon (hco3(-)) transporter